MSNTTYYKANYISSNLHVVEVLPQDFKIVLNDSAKKTAATKNYCNAGFFANFKETTNGKAEHFTLPVGHLLCDYKADSEWTKFYCNARGKLKDKTYSDGTKYTFDTSTWSYDNPLYQKSVSTLLVNSNKAVIKEVISIPAGFTYAISGIPIMRNGVNCSFNNFVKPQGWTGSPLYGTWHTFVGLKQNSKVIYVIGMKTISYNMVATSEAYKKFSKLGLNDVIKLDGGGSFHMNVDGKVVATTAGNRRINSIICF